jgi:hypothetical protein
MTGDIRASGGRVGGPLPFKSPRQSCAAPPVLLDVLRWPGRRNRHAEQRSVPSADTNAAGHPLCGGPSPPGADGASCGAQPAVTCGSCPPAGRLSSAGRHGPHAMSRASSADHGGWRQPSSSICARWRTMPCSTRSTRLRTPLAVRPRGNATRGVGRTAAKHQWLHSSCRAECTPPASAPVESTPQPTAGPISPPRTAMHCPRPVDAAHGPPASHAASSTTTLHSHCSNLAVRCNAYP